MDRLIDGDIASNTHNWQWVEGTGTDAAPYFRIFNPVSQGQLMTAGQCLWFLRDFQSVPAVSRS